MNLRLAVVCAVLVSIAPAFAAAPRDTASATIGGKKVAVEFGRPPLEGRQVDELLAKLPEDRIWRTGSDQFTTFTTETDLSIGGQRVPQGKYSLYVHCPEEGSYSLVLNRVLGQPLKDIFPKAPPELADEPWPHFNYEKEIGDQEVARVPMKQETVSTPVDPFTITLTPAGNGAVMKLAWGDRAWSVMLEPAGHAGH